MKLIVGLGNPGKEYSNTRHNVGFMCLDKYLGDIKWKEKSATLYYEDNINGEKVIYIKPQTYMNLSGYSVKKFLEFYKIDIDSMLIIYDDMDISIGDYKMKVDSGSGGHNGINSIIESLNTKRFNRLKIGISRSNIVDSSDYVLSNFSKEELSKINEVLDLTKEIIDDFINYDMNTAMNKLGERKSELS